MYVSTNEAGIAHTAYGGQSWLAKRLPTYQHRLPTSTSDSMQLVTASHFQEFLIEASVRILNSFCEYTPWFLTAKLCGASPSVYILYFHWRIH